MPKYAADTSVPADRSRYEIERTLQRYGADQFAYMTNRQQAMIAFVAHGRNVRFTLNMPDINDRAFQLTPTGRKRSPTQVQQEWEQATRQRWRALALVVKAKLEAVEAEITTFEQEFLAFIMLPDGTTVGEQASAQLDHIYAGGGMLELMP